MLPSIDIFATILAIAAALAIFRFKVGIIQTLLRLLARGRGAAAGLRCGALTPGAVVLCETNVSSVMPIPKQAPAEIARLAGEKLGAHPGTG